MVKNSSKDADEQSGDTPRQSRWKRMTDTAKDDWRQIKKMANIAGQEVAQTGRVLKKVVKTGSFKGFAKPSNPLATLAMEVGGIEGGQIFQPYFRPEKGDDLAHNEIDGAFKHPHTYGLKNFRVIDLHLESGETTTAWYHSPDKGFPTIVYCHGALGTLYDRKGQLEEFSKRGFGVIMAAYPGMKNNRKPPRGQITILKDQPFPAIDPSEGACIETARAMALYVLNETMGRKEHDHKAKARLERRGTYTKKPPENDPMHKIIFFGESLGSAIALQTANLLEKGESAEEVKWAAVNGRLPLKPYESEDDYASDLTKAHNDIKREHFEFKKKHGDSQPDRGFNESDFVVQENQRRIQGRESLTVPAVICWAPCTSLPERAHEEFPEFNADFWLSNRFETKKAIAEIDYDKTKVLLMHGLDDEYIHPENTQKLLVYSGENNANASGYNANAEFLKGCNHGSTFNRESWEQDTSQLKKIGDTAQKYLADLGLCPYAKDEKINGPATTHAESVTKVTRADAPDDQWASPSLNKPDSSGAGKKI